MESSATPLVALDAVAIDTETTGLDPRRAWVVEIGAVRIAAGVVEAAASIQRRVRPPVAIPAAATKVHGIDDAAVAGAPTFAEVWPQFSAFIGGSVLIGHAVGFDLAVLEREGTRANMSWVRPRTLDTRLLAQLAEPNLADYSLETTAAWLAVEPGDRHSALGDAVTAARIFLALVPKLRARGIRTLAEAEEACRALTQPLTEQHRAGWALPVRPHDTVGRDRSPPRIDSYPYVTRIGSIMKAPARFIAPDASVAGALERMTSERISSLFVCQPGIAPRPEHIGIITERDVLRALATHGAGVLVLPVEQAANRPLACVPADAFAYLAIGRMSRLKVRHLGVTDERGLVIGALSARDLLHLRAESGLILGDEIVQATDVPALARGWAKLPLVARGLVNEGIAAPEIAALISSRLGGLTERAALIAEQRMLAAGQGAPPCPYAVMVLGSAGREESLLAMDQDNALVFANVEPEGPEDRWFATLGSHVADILHEVGVPYCKGGVMAKNAPWRGSIATWRQRIEGWIGRSSPQDLLSVDIFFDLRSVHGDAAMADDLWRAGFDTAHGEAAFAKLLAEAAGPLKSGLGWFGRIRTEQGRIDLKRAGLFGIVTAARVLALRHHVVERSTVARIAGIKALGRGAERDLDALADAQAVFLDLILAQQIEDCERGQPVTNRVAVERLSRRDRARLRGALQAVEHLDELIRDLLV
jgi:CBS domain-containing protein